MKRKGILAAAMRLRFWVIVLTFILALTAGEGLASAQQWQPIGPDGGSVRSLSQDPGDPDRIFLGTSAGRLFLSTDKGNSWTRYAHLGSPSEMVLDHILIDPTDSLNMYVAAWNAQAPNSDGDLFRTHDGGKTWEAASALHGKSIRALALAPSDSKILVAGALDGIFRSLDYGEHWQRISPENHPELKQVESIAIDPANPDVIYAGTWHLPWKTEDGGRNWHSIKKGVIDDSDVFSIVVDSEAPAYIYLSACSGIYRSDSAGELFRKIQGIPYSARRTRSLRMDPVDHKTVYAGTTEGLWKTADAGVTWRRVTGPNVIVNDVLIDPRQPAHLLLATDRGGVLVSDDGGATFTSSNRGFSHRQVSALLVDRTNDSMIFAGLLNDKEFGGVFVSRDRGQSWTQLSNGLDGRDVLALRQTAAGLIAGTDRGIFVLRNNAPRWLPLNGLIEVETKEVKEVVDERPAVVPAAPPEASAPAEKPATGEPEVFSANDPSVVPPPLPMKKIVVKRVVSFDLKSRITSLEVTPKRWFAAAGAVFLVSADSGHTWRKLDLPGIDGVIGVAAADTMAVVASRDAIAVSASGGETWLPAKPFLAGFTINSVAVEPAGDIWVAAKEGVFRSSDMGDTWKRLTFLRLANVASVQFDSANQRILAMSAGSASIFESHDDGHTWSPINSGWTLRSFIPVQGRLLGTTAFDGIVIQPDSSVSMR
jgi:photosystem II stability/assembly factor-like uncharacterized protein